MTCPICTLREPHRPLVCDVCRSRVAGQLREVPDLYALLPAALEPGRGSGQKVSGSRSPLEPLSLSVVDLTLATSSEPVHDEYGDQMGLVPAAARLDPWVREWIEVRRMREHVPAPTVATLAGWLWLRLEWACDSYEAVGDFAGEIRELHATMRTLLRLPRDREYIAGVECRSCEMLALYRQPGSPWVECARCGRMLSEDEYQEWVRLLATHVTKGDAA